MLLRTLLLFVMVLLAGAGPGAPVRRPDTTAPAAGVAAPGVGQAPVKMTKDPVCGTFVVPGKALSLSAGGATHWFCSERCRAEFASRS